MGNMSTLLPSAVVTVADDWRGVFYSVGDKIVGLVVQYRREGEWGRRVTLSARYSTTGHGPTDRLVTRVLVSAGRAALLLGHDPRFDQDMDPGAIVGMVNKSGRGTLRLSDIVVDDLRGKRSPPPQEPPADE